MDENHPGYSLKAPGSSGVSRHLPGHGFPRIDDHLVEPEVTRDEVINGRRVVALPALEPHAIRHSDLDYLVRAHVAPGYLSALDLLTRFGEKSDFATDSSIHREGTDPSTGQRHLEEIAFEVVSEQREGNVTEKAVVMHRRGVRRIFAVFVKGTPRVGEWDSASRSWRILDPAVSVIEDRCLVKPLAVAALLDAGLADNAVAEALIAKQNPALVSWGAAAEARGKEAGRAEGKEAGRAEGMAAGRAEGKAEGLLAVLEARGIAVGPAQREEILRCSDIGRLDRWLVRATVASSVEEVMAETRAPRQP